MVSAGKDRFIHLYTFNFETGYFEIFQSFRDHTSSVNSLLLLDSGRSILSTSNDKTLVLHSMK